MSTTFGLETKLQNMKFDGTQSAITNQSRKKKHESKFNELSEKEDRNDFGQRLPLQDE